MGKELRDISKNKNTFVSPFLKHLSRRTFAVKVLRDKAFNIAKDPKYDRYQRSLVSMLSKFFDKSLLVVVLKMKRFLIKN